MKKGRATAADAAKHIKRSVVTFARLLNEGIIQRQDRDTGYDLKAVREDFIDHLTAISSGRGGDAGEKLSVARARSATASAESLELKNAITRGEYIRADVMVDVVTAMIMTSREIALQAPGKISDTLSAYCSEDRAKIFEIVRDEIYAMLDALSVADLTAHLKQPATETTDE